MDDMDGMGKFLEYMRKKADRAHSLLRKESIDGAINYVEGLQCFFDVSVEEVPEYCKHAIADNIKRKIVHHNKDIELAMDMHKEWSAL